MLKEKIANGSFNFSKFVQVMEHDGYITELDSDPDIALGSTIMEKFLLLQEEFDEIYSFFYPKQTHEIEFRCLATNEGLPSGGNGYSYALYNKHGVEAEDVMKALIYENMQSED